MFYTFSSEYDWFGDVIFVSGPFLRNFCLEGIIVVGFIFPQIYIRYVI